VPPKSPPKYFFRSETIPFRPNKPIEIKAYQHQLFALDEVKALLKQTP
jgi:hypothetical protein